ncbi:MAG: hypothetical protein JSR58_05645 [Verrucomicrobia bacterium]|nr:hypothetical protein [Verrucomicrobiota bacterium]
MMKFLFIYLFARILGASQAEVKQFRDHFKDTLLVIHYNHPYYDSLPFEKILYGPIFPHIVFYGPAGEHPEVRVVPTHMGYFFSKVVADTLQTYPDFDGYIFLQDDCLMHFWNYLRLDKNKIWFCQNEIRYLLQASTQDPAGWTWWFSNPDVGMPQVLKQLPLLKESEKKQLTLNMGENTIPGQMCDMFYLPARLAPQAERLCKVFENVFCEISIATILCCIEPLADWEKFNYFWTCGDSGQLVRSKYDPALDWMHPMKFSLRENREFALAMFQAHFYSK